MEVCERAVVRAARKPVVALCTLVMVTLSLGAQSATQSAATRPTSAAKAAAAQPKGPQAPQFVVDMLWPKPLPAHQLLGSAVGEIGRASCRERV